MDGPCLEVLCFVVARNLVAELVALFWQKSRAARQPDTATFAGTHMNTLREAYFESINHQASYGIHVRARLQQATSIVSTLQASVNASHCNAQHNRHIRYIHSKRTQQLSWCSAFLKRRVAQPSNYMAEQPPAQACPVAVSTCADAGSGWPLQQRHLASNVLTVPNT